MYKGQRSLSTTGWSWGDTRGGRRSGTHLANLQCEAFQNSQSLDFSRPFWPILGLDRQPQSSPPPANRRRLAFGGAVVGCAAHSAQRSPSENRQGPGRLRPRPVEAFAVCRACAARGPHIGPGRVALPVSWAARPPGALSFVAESEKQLARRASPTFALHTSSVVSYVGRDRRARCGERHSAGTTCHPGSFLPEFP
jgi:hypothetical protein